jgi:hypothetical protein
MVLELFFEWMVLELFFLINEFALHIFLRKVKIQYSIPFVLNSPGINHPFGLDTDILIGNVLLPNQELTRLKALDCFPGHKGSQHHHLALKNLGSVQTIFLKTM